MAKKNPADIRPKREAQKTFFALASVLILAFALVLPAQAEYTQTKHDSYKNAVLISTKPRPQAPAPTQVTNVSPVKRIEQEPGGQAGVQPGVEQGSGANTPPVWRQIPDKQINSRVGAPGRLVKLSEYFYDEQDGFEKLVFFFGQSNKNLVDCFIEQDEAAHESYISCGTPALIEGKNRITITARDTKGLRSGTSFTVNVKHTPNTPPILHPLPNIDIEPNSGLHPRLVDLSLYSSDNETPKKELVYGIAQSKPSLIPCYIEYIKEEEKTYVSCSAPAKNTGGTNTITIIVTDKDGAETRTNFTITVKQPVNTAPVCRLDGIVFDEQDKSKEVTLKINGSDADGDSIAEASVQWGDGIVNGLQKPSSLPMEMMHTYTNNNNSYTISFTITDNRGAKSSECTWPITFHPKQTQEPTCSTNWYCKDAVEARKDSSCNIVEQNSCANGCDSATGRCRRNTRVCIQVVDNRCFENDLYGYTCGERAGKVEECGETSCEPAYIDYCKNGDLYAGRNCVQKGCSGNACYSNTTIDEIFRQSCGGRGCHNTWCTPEPRCEFAYRYCDNGNVHDTLTCYTYTCTDSGCISNGDAKRLQVEDCGGMGCNNGQCNPAPPPPPPPNPNCTSHHDKICWSDGESHWRDSCGNLEEVAENCRNDTCYRGECYQPGESGYCSKANKCKAGFGDCDDDKECRSGLKCMQNVGTQYGYDNSDDVCVDPAGGKCTPRSSFSCNDGDVYWFDSCNEREDKKEECATLGCSGNTCNQTSCNKYAKLGCISNYVVWQDSCGNAHDFIEDCGNKTCSNGACVARLEPVDGAGIGVSLTGNSDSVESGYLGVIEWETTGPVQETGLEVAYNSSKSDTKKYSATISSSGKYSAALAPTGCNGVYARAYARKGQLTAVTDWVFMPVIKESCDAPGLGAEGEIDFDVDSIDIREAGWELAKLFTVGNCIDNGVLTFGCTFDVGSTALMFVPATTLEAGGAKLAYILSKGSKIIMHAKTASKLAKIVRKITLTIDGAKIAAKGSDVERASELGLIKIDFITGKLTTLYKKLTAWFIRNGDSAIMRLRPHGATNDMLETVLKNGADLSRTVRVGESPKGAVWLEDTRWAHITEKHVLPQGSWAKFSEAGVDEAQVQAKIFETVKKPSTTLSSGSGRQCFFSEVAAGFKYAYIKVVAEAGGNIITAQPINTLTCTD